MNIFLWTLQVLLALQFLWHGWILLFPPAELTEIINAEFALWFRIFLGVAEVLAAVGLILPGVIRILPSLISVTCVCLMVVMVSATVHHVLRGETMSAITTAGLFVTLAFVGYMRWKVKPIPGRMKSI